MAAVTLTDVAVRAGVSQPTASRVLNGSARRPGPAVVEAVRRAAHELGYVANAQAQALARSSTGLLGMVVHDIADPYFSAIAGGVQSAAQRHGRRVLLATTLRDPEQEMAAISAFISYRTDAMVLVGSRSNGVKAKEVMARVTAGLARYTANGGRVAVIGQGLPNAQVLSPQNKVASAALANALVGLGHRRFAVLSGPHQLQTAVDRAKGFIAALATHGISPEMVIAGEFTRDGGYSAAQEVLRRSTSRRAGRPLCLFASNDVMALGAMAAFREAGKIIPDDIQVAGFDDIPTLRDVSPGLTTVRLPLKGMGERAVELLFGEDSHRVIREPVSYEVILRQTTAPVLPSGSSRSIVPAPTPSEGQ